MGGPHNHVKQPPAADDLTGTTVSRFSIRARLGGGGMGEVYLADDPALKRSVAIKRMSTGMRANRGDRQRFLREGQRASALNHPNVAGIYDVVEHQDEVFLVMEYVDGGTLRQRLKEPFSAQQFLEIAIQCADALAAAHEKCILHGDIKPENIMLTPSGQVKILDFGVAKRISAPDPSAATASLETMTNSLSGTPAYMAPEVLLQKPHDSRADIFALGLVFYEMLSGRHPFLADTFAGTVDRVLHQNPFPLARVNPRVPESLSRIVARTLAKEPDQRYASARELATALRAVQQGAPSFLSALIPERRRRGYAAALVLGLGAAILLGLLLVSPPFRHRLRNWVRSPRLRQGAPSGAPALPRRENLVVLPFRATAADPKVTAFGNGLVETLTAKLTQLSATHPLQVIPASEMRDKDVTTLQQARQEFGANLGLQVGLQRSGDLFRVTYTLIDTGTGRALAANTITAPVTDSFGIEDRVAEGAASALGAELRPEERREFASHGTTQPEAYNYYLEGRGYLQDPFKLDNVNSALILFAQALQLDPGYGLAKAGLGEAYWRKYEDTKDKKWIALARANCNKAVELGNAGAEGHQCLGLLANGAGEYEQAVEQFQRAVELDPTNDQGYIGLARAYQLLGKLDEAERSYQRVISLRPQYWRGYNLLGIFYLSEAQYDKAAEMFKRVIELAPDAFAGYNNLAAAYRFQGRYADCIPPLERSLAIRPTPAAYSNLATAYFELRQFANAARYYHEATQRGANDYALWGNLGDAYYYGGNRGEATAAYRKALDLAQQQLEVNPRDAEVLGDVAQYYAMLGYRREALSYVDRSLQLGHRNKDLLFNAALVYDQLGESGVALEWLEKSLAAGFSLQTVRDAPALDNLRSNPRFQELMRQK